MKNASLPQAATPPAARAAFGPAPLACARPAAIAAVIAARAPLAAIVAAAIAALTLGAAPAQAQRVSLSEGVSAPLPTLVERDDALSLELNPAGLARISGAEMFLLYGTFADDLNGGIGVLTAVELLSGLGMGLGVQFIEPGVAEEGYRKYSLGLGLGGDLSLGLTLNLFGSSDDQRIDDLVTWDLGLQYRLLRWLGAGFMVRDANAPFFGGSAIKPQLAFGGAARTLQGRLIFEADVTVSGSPRVQPRFMASVEPFEGLRLFAQLLTDTGEKGQDFEMTEFSAGLAVDTAHLGFGGAATSGQGRGGFSGSMRVSNAAWRAFVEGGKRFYTVKIGGDMPERSPRNLLGLDSGPSFLSTMQTLDGMRQDDLVEGVVVELNNVTMGYGQAWELREALVRLKEAGKAVVVYMHTPSHREFYIATAAEHIFMGPSTTFSARGLAISQSFYRGAFDKIGVKPDFIRIAEYKSAPESFTRESPSEPAEEALGAFLDSIWATQLDAMAGGRGLSTEAMADLIETAPHDPGQALQSGLIDKVIYPDEIKDTLKALYGRSTKLSATYDRLEKDYTWGQKPIVAVLHIDGNIVTGSGGTNPLLGGSLTGSRTVEKVAEWAAREPNVKALVVRIDSPGGSATASDLMYRALVKLGEKKPVIVSMGDIAASGGYYVAATGQEIFCNPTTLTGSIGIYSGKFALDGLFAKIGLNTVTVERGDRADLYAMDRPWDDAERAVITEQITYLYELFLSQVSAGRDMERDAVHAVGRGRIWSGADAQRVGLCDTQGGLLDAIERAREKAGLDADDFQIVSVPEGDILAPLIPDIGLDLGHLATLRAPGLPTLLPEATEAQIWDAYAPLRQLAQPLRPALDLGVLYADGEALALMPFVVQWR